MIKKCCFNCSCCYMNHNNCNELVCKINGIIKKQMTIEQAESQYCESFIKDDDMADPYD